MFNSMFFSLFSSFLTYPKLLTNALYWTQSLGACIKLLLLKYGGLKDEVFFVGLHSLNLIPWLKCYHQRTAVTSKASSLDRLGSVPHPLKLHWVLLAGGRSRRQNRTLISAQTFPAQQGKHSPLE